LATESPFTGTIAVVCNLSDADTACQATGSGPTFTPVVAGFISPG
jgi:hypothetical protein